MAFAVNGKLQEVNIYPGRPLAQRIYPRLLETYALDAVMQASEDKAAAKAKAPASVQVLALLKSNVKAQAQREEEINADNGLSIFAAEKTNDHDKTRFYRFATQFKGQTVHLQWIQGPQSLDEASRNERNPEQQLNLQNGNRRASPQRRNPQGQ